MHKGNSELAKTIREAAKKVHEGCPDEYHQVFHGCGHKSGGCHLSPALEALFAGTLAQMLTKRLMEKQDKWLENEVLYAPHTTSECNVGFDYSVGHFEGFKRVRWMHKHASNWCDDSFRWEPKNKDETKRCVNHADLLLTQFRIQNYEIRPFLVLSVCYCLHEYRRMGRAQVPDVDDERRWVIADLRPLAACEKEHIASGNFEYVRWAEGQSASWMISDIELIPLPLVSLQDFLEIQSTFLSE
jgi:hypothetical protein